MSVVPDQILEKLQMNIIQNYFMDLNDKQRGKLVDVQCRWMLPAATELNSKGMLTAASTTYNRTNNRYLIRIHPSLGISFARYMKINNVETNLRGANKVRSFVIEYILLHELNHVILGPNHTSDFLNRERRFEKRDKAKKWLSDNGYSVVEGWE